MSVMAGRLNRGDGTLLPRQGGDDRAEGGSAGRSKGSDLSTLRRGLEILQLLQQHTSVGNGPGLGNNRIAELLDADKSQVSRTLRVLAETGFVERDEESKTYRLGAGVYALGMGSTDQSLLRVGSSAVRHAMMTLDCRVYLTVRRGAGVMTLWSDQPNELRPHINSNGIVYPLAGLETGRALLYASSPREIEEILDDGTRDPQRVREFIQRVQADRKEGFSFGVLPEREMSVVAVPVWGRERRIVAALGATIPTAEKSVEIIRAARVLLSTSAEMTRRHDEIVRTEASSGAVPYFGWPGRPEMTVFR